MNNIKYERQFRPVEVAEVGVVRYVDGEGRVRVFRGNRADRRKFIKRNKLVKQG